MEVAIVNLITFEDEQLEEHLRFPFLISPGY
jgi:hypothetical protein